MHISIKDRSFLIIQNGPIVPHLTFLIQCWVMALARSNSIARFLSFCHFFHTKDAAMLAITTTDSSTTVSTMMAWYSASSKMGSAGKVVKGVGESKGMLVVMMRRRIIVMEAYDDDIIEEKRYSIYSP